ncbi:hypothetical protein [Nocardia caishijiensis]|uniref:Uncharacterized protein n=1 Tax=Nocardia caishijiensis TaxID=184756 RepID=A0ABQ6YJR9_9NOCA|nr:hypothetical protein [Nocardia caishijiensis]KAF0845686.1 hypothetical protein FNL39_10673 [Nocardia caishijiensis]
MGAFGIVAVGGALIVGAVSGWWWNALGAPVGAATASFYTFLLVTPVAVSVAVVFGVLLPFAALLRRRMPSSRVASAWIACALLTVLVTMMLWAVAAAVTLFLSLRAAAWAGGVPLWYAEHYLWQMFDPATVTWSAAQTVVVATFVVFLPLTVEHRRGPADHSVARRRVRINAVAVLLGFATLYAVIAIYQARVIPGYIGLD